MMLIYSLEAHPSVTSEIEISDVGISVPASGLLAVDDESLALDLQASNELRILLTDDAFGTNNSTVRMIHPVSGQVPQGEIDSFLDDQEEVEVVGQYAKVAITGQNTINNSTATFGTFIILDSLIETTIPGLTVSESRIRTWPDGVYEVSCELSLNSTRPRANIGWRMWQYNSNDSVFSRAGANYNRAASGHNETGDSFSQVIVMNQGVTNNSLWFSGVRLAASGTVNLESTAGGTSIINIKRLRDL